MASLSGTLGHFNTRSLLTMLEASGASGTLFVAGEGASSLILLRAGKPQLHYDLSASPFGRRDGRHSGATRESLFDIDKAGLLFGFWPHTESQPLPTVPTYAENRSGERHNLLRALPPLLEQPLLSTAETGLRALVERLTEERFTGALSLSAEALEGVLLFQEGQFCSALCTETAEGRSRTRGGALALKTLLHLAERAELTRFVLPELIVASLLGLLLNLQLEGVERAPEDFSGLELSPAGVRYYRAGTPYLQVRQTAMESLSYKGSGFYSLCDHPPQLKLPSEPSGWEGWRYQLTLRGRDALNPMTELAMRFRNEFGRNGQRALEQFRKSPSLEEAAGSLNVDLDELRSTVERLEADSFIRRLA